MIGVVLAGGRSTRLGQDKVRLRLPGDGRDMLAAPPIPSPRARAAGSSRAGLPVRAEEP